MTAIRIRPEAQGSVSLCSSCHWAHIQHGFAESEEAVLCVFLRPARMVPFKVSQCTDYTDKRIPSRRDMEEIAWIIPTKRVNGSMGFAAKDDASEAQDDELEIVPAD